MVGESVIMDFLRSQEEKQNQNGQQEKQIVYIDIEDLEASKENFYGLRDLETLKASISLHGLLQPILVIPARIEGKYTVLGGGRRRQAIEELVDKGKEELRKVPCIISDGKIQGEDTEEEPDEVQELIGKLNIISANSFREKTDWERMEETLQIGSIIKELKNLGKLKGNVREMQVELSGIKGTQIARYNAIMNHLSLELMQAFKNNDFGISVAYELSRLSETYQQQAWEIFLENKILTLSDAEKLHNLQKAEEEEENLEGQMEIQEFLKEETSIDNRQESVQDISIITEEELEEEPEETIPEEKEIQETEAVESPQQKESAQSVPDKENTVQAKTEPEESTEKQRSTVKDGWIEQEPVAPPQQNAEEEIQQEASEKISEETFKEWTPGEVLKEKREELNRWIEAFAGEEEPEAIKKQRIIVDALEHMVKNLQQEEQQEQPPLPKLKNNDQRKEWLREYRSWGIWYKDKHIGVTYYRYQFGNGADLIVEEYENENEYTGTYASSYFHLVGGPEPPRKNGIPKRTKHEKYSRYPNSETELVEFLKEIQKG